MTGASSLVLAAVMIAAGREEWGIGSEGTLNPAELAKLAANSDDPRQRAAALTGADGVQDAHGRETHLRALRWPGG